MAVCVTLFRVDKESRIPNPYSVAQRCKGFLLHKSPDGKHADAVLAWADACLSDGTTGMRA